VTEPGVIERVGVVVPAHNEETLLPACLAALRRAAREVCVPVRLVVAADADTVVPASWLQRQVAHADRGWDVVLGTVTVADWSEHPPHVPAAFAARYESGDRPHPYVHVHGANIGIRASAYRAAGGFAALRSAEDHALVAAADAGCSVLRADDVTVQTSARRHARAPHGFSHLLRTLAPARVRAGRPRGRAL